jgi:hypothetical protein
MLALILIGCTAPGQETTPTADINETSEPAETAAASAVPTLETPTTETCESLPEITTEGIIVPENAVIVFQKTGGFAGVNETSVIYVDGLIENDKSESYQATPDVVEGLVTTAEGIGFFDLKNNYVPEGYCCDFFNYSLTIRDCEKVHTVMTADAVPDSPIELQELVTTIQSLVDNTSAAVPPSRNSRPG